MVYESHHFLIFCLISDVIKYVIGLTVQIVAPMPITTCIIIKPENSPKNIKFFAQHYQYANYSVFVLILHGYSG